MSLVFIPTKFQWRKDTAANWTANNPTPLNGEPCLETDTRKLKLGDGVTAWNALDYLDASFWPYDNTASGLDAANTQAALDELAARNADIRDTWLMG